MPATVGLFAFAFTRQVLFPRFWLYFVVVYVGFWILYYFVTSVDLSDGLTRSGYLLSQAFSWLISLPGYIALYLYSRPTDMAWNEEP